ncbi:MAG: PAS domain-containing protein [Anaerolineales bacterium]|nr:PAS domain-containing protein [Anaerolineales bacterium]
MFKLLRYFSVTSFIAFVVVAALLGVFYRQLVLSHLIEIAENKNIALTQAFSNSLWPQFAPFVTSASGLSVDELRSHPEISRLHQAVLRQMEGLTIVKVKVYNLNGLTVFSTEAKQIGEDKSNNAGYLAARSGQVASELTHRETFSAFEDTIEDRDVFSSYIPIRRGGPTGPIEGVFEVYDDVTPLIQRLEQAQRNVIIGVSLTLALLYAVLFFIVKRADDIIQHQYSELKHSTAALQESEERFRQVISSISDHIYMTKLTKNEPINHYISPNFEALTGYRSEKLMAEWNFWPSSLIHPDDRAAAAAQFEKFAHGQNSEVEYRLIRADGQVIWIRDSGRVEKDADQESIIIYGVISDITGRKQAEEALALARDEALKANRLKSQLLANVSHDLRTPLSAILGYVDMLQFGVYGPLTTQQQSITQKIMSCTTRLTDLVNHLLDQAQLEAGTLKLNPTWLAPAGLIDQVKSTLGILVEAKGLQLISDIAADVPPLVWGDPARLEQIIINLVSNAIKFTEQGSVRICIYRPDETHWAIQVSDTGPGIPSEAHSYIFEAFRQVDNGVTPKQSGTGLGLSIVKQLTTLMEGQVTVESRVGQGSTFTALLPLIQKPEVVT